MRNDLGRPIAYLVLQDGTSVFDVTGTPVGEVEHVLADETVDIFHGLIIRTRPSPGERLFADREQVAEIYERGVLLSVDTGSLHRPSLPRGGAATGPLGDVEAGLRRAWEWISQQPEGPPR